MGFLTREKTKHQISILLPKRGEHLKSAFTPFRYYLSSLEFDLVGSLLDSIISLGLAFFYSSLTCLDSLVGSFLSSIDSCLGGILSSTDCIVHGTFYGTRSFIDSITGCIFGIAGKGFNLFEDSGQRSNIDVEVLQSLCILLNESLNLGGILGKLLSITLSCKLVQLFLNGCDCSSNSGGIACLYLFRESINDCLGSGFLEVEGFLGGLATSTCAETHCSCESCHCK